MKKPKRQQSIVDEVYEMTIKLLEEQKVFSKAGIARIRLAADEHRLADNKNLLSLLQEDGKEDDDS